MLQPHSLNSEAAWKWTNWRGTSSSGFQKWTFVPLYKSFKPLYLRSETQSSRCQAGHQLCYCCYHNSRVSLSLCHCWPCLCARTVAMDPDRRRLVLHSFSEQDPLISYPLRRGFGFTQEEMGLMYCAFEGSISLLVKAHTASWQGPYCLYESR